MGPVLADWPHVLSVLESAPLATVHRMSSMMTHLAVLRARLYEVRFVLAALVLFAVVLVRTAWVNDDTYITLRVIDNFLDGHGLRWNVAERVQAYTHPLWLALLLAAIVLTGEYFYTVILVSMVISLIALSIAACRVARTQLAGVLVVLCALTSRAFVDFSTSGLENPLTNLLLAIFVLRWSRQRADRRELFELSLIAALAILTRPDAALFYAPALGCTAWRLGLRSALRPLLLGFAPFVVWELFSFVYYGFLVPNTAVAKLNTGLGTWELVRQGGYYFYNALRYDPVTLLAVVGAAIAAVWRRDRQGLLLLAGIALYLLYIVRIGGDFMSGRFFAAPFFGALLILARQPLTLRTPATYLALAVILIAGWLVHPQPAFATGPDFGANRQGIFQGHGIADERRFYHRGTGLVRTGGGSEPQNGWTANGRDLAGQPGAVRPFPSVGFIGFYAGPAVTIVDENGLADPLLARLPARYDPKWRIGHFTRHVPAGYLRSLKSGRNELQDQQLAAYWDKLRLVTRGPLLSWKRLKIAFWMNLGAYDHLIDAERYRFPNGRP